MIDYYKKYLKYKQKYIQKKYKSKGGANNQAQDQFIFNFLTSDASPIPTPPPAHNSWKEFLAYKDTIHDFYKDRGMFLSPIRQGNNVKELIQNKYSKGWGGFLLPEGISHSSVEEQTENWFLNNHTDIKKYKNLKEIQIYDLEDKTLRELDNIKNVEFDSDSPYDTLKITLGDDIKTQMKTNPFFKKGILNTDVPKPLQTLYGILKTFIVNTFSLKAEQTNTISIDANQSYLNNIFPGAPINSDPTIPHFTTLKTAPNRGDSALGISEKKSFDNHNIGEGDWGNEICHDGAHPCTYFPKMKDITLKDQEISAYQFSSNIFTSDMLMLFYFKINNNTNYNDKSNFYFLVIRPVDILTEKGGYVTGINLNLDDLTDLNKGYAVEFVQEPWNKVKAKKKSLSAGLSVSNLTEIIRCIHKYDLTKESDWTKINDLFKKGLLKNQLYIFEIIKKIYKDAGGFQAFSADTAKSLVTTFLLDYKRAGDYEQVNSAKYIDNERDAKVILTTGDRLCSLYSRLRNLNTIYTINMPYTMYFYKGISTPLKFDDVWKNIQNADTQNRKNFPAIEYPIILENYIDTLNSFDSGDTFLYSINGMATQPAQINNNSTDKMFHVKSWGTKPPGHKGWVVTNNGSWWNKLNNPPFGFSFNEWVNPSYSPILNIYKKFFEIMHKIGPNKFSYYIRVLRKKKAELKTQRNTVSMDAFGNEEYKKNENNNNNNLFDYFENKKEYNKIYTHLIKIYKKLNILNIHPVSHLKSSYCQYPLITLIKYYFIDIFNKCEPMKDIISHLIDFPEEDESRVPVRKVARQSGDRLPMFFDFDKNTEDEPDFQQCIKNLLTHFVLLLEDLEYCLDNELDFEGGEILKLKNILKNSSLIYLIDNPSLNAKPKNSYDKLIKKNNFINKEINPEEKPKGFMMKWVETGGNDDEHTHYLKLMSKESRERYESMEATWEADTNLNEKASYHEVGLLNIVSFKLNRILEEYMEIGPPEFTHVCLPRVDSDLGGGATGNSTPPYAHAFAVGEEAFNSFQNLFEYKQGEFGFTGDAEGWEASSFPYMFKTPDFKNTNKRPEIYILQNDGVGDVFMTPIDELNKTWEAEAGAEATKSGETYDHFKVSKYNNFNYDNIIQISEIKESFDLSLSNIFLGYYNFYEDILTGIKNDIAMRAHPWMLHPDVKINDIINDGAILFGNFEPNLELSADTSIQVYDFILLSLIFAPFDAITQIMFPYINKIKILIETEYGNRSSENYKMRRYMNYKENIELIILQQILHYYEKVGEDKLNIFSDINKNLKNYYDIIHKLLKPALHINLSGGLIFALLSANMLYREYFNPDYNYVIQWKPTIHDIMEEFFNVIMGEELQEAPSRRQINYIEKKFNDIVKGNTIEDLLIMEIESIGDFDTKLSMKLPPDEIDEILAAQKELEADQEFLLGRLKMGFAPTSARNAHAPHPALRLRYIQGEQIDIGYSILNKNILSKLTHSNLADFEKLLIELAIIIFNDPNDKKIEKRLRRFILLTFIKNNDTLILGEKFEDTTILKQLHEIMSTSEVAGVQDMDTHESALLMKAEAGGNLEIKINERVKKLIKLNKNFIEKRLYHYQKFHGYIYPQIYNPGIHDSTIENKYPGKRGRLVIESLKNTKDRITIQTEINILNLMKVEPNEIGFKTLAKNLHGLLKYMQDNISIALLPYDKKDVLPYDEEDDRPKGKDLVTLVMATLLENVLCNSIIVDKWYNVLAEIYNKARTEQNGDWPIPSLLEWMNPEIAKSIEWDIIANDDVSTNIDWKELRARKKALETKDVGIAEKHILSVLQDEIDNCSKNRNFAKITMNTIKIELPPPTRDQAAIRIKAVRDGALHRLAGKAAENKDLPSPSRSASSSGEEPILDEEEWYNEGNV